MSNSMSSIDSLHLAYTHTTTRAYIVIPSFPLSSSSPSPSLSCFIFINLSLSFSLITEICSSGCKEVNLCIDVEELVIKSATTGMVRACCTTCT